MRIRRFIRNVKILFVSAGFILVGIKASGNLPSISWTDTSLKTQSVSRPDAVSRSFSDYLPEDRLQRPVQLLFREAYVVSYNKETKCPNWVLWELTRNHADGNVKRPDYAFHEDMEVPTPRAELLDYKGCGYDRGHMCPAGDNKWDQDAMYESFLLTNICPQNQQLNSGLWNQLEMQCRYWAKKYGRLYICCGPIYLKGKHETIGPNRVMVPDAFFKVVLCLEGTPKGIAFICRNTDGSRKKDYYVNSINQVERITGYTFFPNLSEELSAIVKHEDSWWN